MPDQQVDNRAMTTIAYTGTGVAQGLMDVRDLGPALLAIGQVCQASNRVLNGDAAEISTYVRSDIRRGSFEVSLEIAQIVQQAATIVAANRESLTDAKLIMELLGLGAGGTGAMGVGVFKFVKWLRNRKPEKVKETSAGTIHVELGGEHIEISNSVFVLAKDRDVRSALEEVVRPLNRQGIDGFEVRRDGVPELLASSADVTAFTAPRENERLPENLLSESEHVAVLEVVRPHFESGHRWGLSDGSRSVGVEMKDEQFLGRVQRHEITFGKGDALRMKLRTRVWRDDAGALKSSQMVTEVLEVLPAPKQLLLPN